MDVNKEKDGEETQLELEAPPIANVPKLEGTIKKKRRRGKSKRKVMKPFIKVPWQERRRNDKTKRNNRFRKIVLSKTQAPFNNNQFLMEIHKPEPENNFELLRTPSARTRDSSFSVDSEENYFYSLPEDEEEYLTKEFSSVYEDAQSERLSNMSKNELIQEYLLLEAKYENLIKRTERSKSKYTDEDKDTTATDKDISFTDKDSMATDRDTTTSSAECSVIDLPAVSDIAQRVKEQEEQIRDLQEANEKLQCENELLRQKCHESSSEDSESDSSSTSVSSSSSAESASPVRELTEQCNGTKDDNEVLTNGDSAHVNGLNEYMEEADNTYPLVNGFSSPHE